MSPEERGRPADREETTGLGDPALRREEMIALAEIVRDECEGDLEIGLTEGGVEVGRRVEALAEHRRVSGESRIGALFISGRRGRTRITVVLAGECFVRVAAPDEGSRRAVAAMVEVVRGHQRRFTDRAWTGILLGALGVVAAVGYAGVLARTGLLGTGHGLGVVALLVVALGFVLWGQSTSDEGPGVRLVNRPRGLFRT